MRRCGRSAVSAHASSGSGRRVSTMVPHSTTFSVSVAGCPTTTPSSAGSATISSIAEEMTAGVTSGRAPSWMATRSKSSLTSARPAATESCRRAPPATTTDGARRPMGETAVSAYSSTRSGCVTTTSRPTSGTASNARSAHDITGSPAISSSCLPPSRPNRSPEPPATMIAATEVTRPPSSRSSERRSSVPRRSGGPKSPRRQRPLRRLSRPFWTTTIVPSSRYPTP